MLAKDKTFKEEALIQFSFYKKGYEKDGVNYALILRKRKRYIVKNIICSRKTFTKTRKRNPVFVVETYGILLIQNSQAIIC